MQFHNGITKFREDQRDRAPNLFTIYQLGCWSTNVRVFESCSFSKSLGPVVDQIPLNSYIIRIEWTAGNRKNEPSTFRLCALDDGQISFRGYIFSIAVTLLVRCSSPYLIVADVLLVRTIIRTLETNLSETYDFALLTLYRVEVLSSLWAFLVFDTLIEIVNYDNSIPIWITFERTPNIEFDSILFKYQLQLWLLNVLTFRIR